MKHLLISSLLLTLVLAACGTKATAVPTPAPTHEAPPTASSSAPSAVSPTASAAATTSGSPSACTDAAAFVADVTIPDYSHFDVHATFTKTWRVQNTGTCPWTTAYTAVYSSGTQLGSPLSIPLSSTAPGATSDISANMAAPSADGTYKIFYELHNAAGQAIPINEGNTIWAIITVGKVVVYVTPTPVPGSTSSTVSTGSRTAPGGCVTQSNASFTSQTLSLINSARAAAGLPALHLNTQLSASAQAHSQDMACSGLLSHTGSDGSTADSRIASAGYNASITRENIYAQPPQYGGNPQAAMDWWMSDSTHREAVLNSQVTDVGVGYASYSSSPLGGYFTVDFAAP